jgi:hypothetical protein
MKMNATIDSFYRSESSGLHLPTYAVTPHSLEVVQSTTKALHPLEMPEKSSIEDKLHEIGKNVRVISYGDSTFEVAVVNEGVSKEKIMLHISTYSSSISGNAGNAYELAMQAALYPNYVHIYVASFGNGGTSPLLPEDAVYARETGRFTEERGDDTVAIQSIQNMHHALENEGLAVTNVMGTDSAGGPYARAYALTLDEDQLDSAFFSEVSGMVHLSIPRIVYGIAMKEMFINSKNNEKISPDCASLKQGTIALEDGTEISKEQFAKMILDSYADMPNRKLLVAKQIGGLAKLQAMYTSLQSLRRGPKGNKNPFIDDTNALLERHPTAQITYGFADKDPLYKENPELLRNAIIEQLSQLSVQQAGVRAVVIPKMTHAYNTHFPTLYHAIQADSLSI